MKTKLILLIILMAGCSKPTEETKIWDCDCQTIYTRGFQGTSNIQATSLRICEIGQKIDTLASGSLYIDWGPEKGQQKAIEQGCN